MFALQIKVIAIIAEGIPENMTRKMIKIADAKGVTIIGPATVCIFFFTLIFYPNLVSVKNKKSVQILQVLFRFEMITYIFLKFYILFDKTGLQ